MNGNILAFSPCAACTRKEMCSICELAYFKSGAITPQSSPAETLPLSIGDSVYVIRKGKVAECSIRRIGITGRATTYGINRVGCGYELFLPHDIGKTVFLTSEEAQKHLEERNESPY